MNTKTMGIAWLAIAAVTVIILAAGCESTGTTENVITVTPASVQLVWPSNIVTLVASVADTNTTLVLPLEWAVQDPSLGFVQNAAGFSAVYFWNTGKPGLNTIIVTDQADREGLVSIAQAYPEEEEEEVALGASEGGELIP